MTQPQTLKLPITPFLLQVAIPKEMRVRWGLVALVLTAQVYRQELQRAPDCTPRSLVMRIVLPLHWVWECCQTAGCQTHLS